MAHGRNTLSFGGCEENETLEECLLRELEEEIGEIYDDFERFKLFGRHNTKWASCHIFELLEPEAKHGYFSGAAIELELFGYEWLNFQEDRACIQTLKPFMMPGLKMTDAERRDFKYALFEGFCEFCGKSLDSAYRCYCTAANEAQRL